MADYAAPRDKRVMLPLSKFAFLPEKIQIGLDQASDFEPPKHRPSLCNERDSLEW